MTKLLGILGTLAILAILTNFLPVVTELPFGMDFALTFLVSTINALITLMPWFGIVWTYILWAMLIKSLLFIFHWVIFFLNQFSGGGSAPGGR